MKIFKAFLLVLISLLLVNFITYSIWGKASLRSRNIDEIMALGFENYFNLDQEYMMWSDMDYRDSFTLDGQIYPVFNIDNTGDNNDIDEILKSDAYVDSTLFYKGFKIHRDTVNALLGINLNSLPPESAETILEENFDILLNSMPDSLDLVPETSTFRGNCEDYSTFNETIENVDCFVDAIDLQVLIEDIYDWKPFYVQQEINAWTYGSDFDGMYRVEQLVWLFFTWVQIELVDGNGLDGDRFWLILKSNFSLILY